MKEPGAKRCRVELDECRRAMEAFFAGGPAHGVSKLEETVRAPNILVAKAMSAGLKLGTGLDLGDFFFQKPLRRCMATQRRYEIPSEELPEELRRGTCVRLAMEDLTSGDRWLCVPAEIRSAPCLHVTADQGAVGPTLSGGLPTCALLRRQA